ncbi:DUF397 domain-containing protein [Nocardia sp. NBC_01327]|uniref:DUF397 domain-containing protein n=1 Tax=Nocardia sp. NBC_01327 TaxID=2903593 RepID=UPI002E1117BB|nr:DUF397 domain-containing protein [Nocardia sp. NBC_01327]
MIWGCRSDSRELPCGTHALNGRRSATVYGRASSSVRESSLSSVRPTLDASRRTTWRKSSFSGDGGGGNCVEVKFSGCSVLIRDSKYLRDPANDPARQPVVAVPLQEWDVFLRMAVDATLVLPGLRGQRSR